METQVRSEQKRYGLVFTGITFDPKQSALLPSMLLLKVGVLKNPAI